MPIEDDISDEVADPAPRLVIIADDLTGALDSAAPFASHGFTARMALKPEGISNASVLSFTTDSRDDPAELAGRKVGQLSEFNQDTKIYKKVDSTLRGNIAIELDKLVSASHRKKVLIAPAFPSQGRTTVNGSQLVHGKPIAEVKQGGRVLYSKISSHIPHLLAGQISGAVRCLGLEWLEAGPQILAQRINQLPERYLVLDATLDEHLVTIADTSELLGSDTILCGSAGLSTALARVWQKKTDLAENLRSPTGFVKPPVLFITGSLNSVTIGQVSRLICSIGEVESLRISPLCLLSGYTGGTVNHVVSTLHAGRHVVLGIASKPRISKRGRDLAQGLASITGEILRQVQPGILALTGGDIAMAVSHILGADGLELLGEFMVGIPISMFVGGLNPGLHVMTKAGGLGPPDQFLQVVHLANNI